MPRTVRLLYRFLGIVAVALGVIGIFLPIMPTVPFILLAAFLFARSDPAWERWLLDHPRFGPPIHAWRANRAIGLRAKVLAIVMLSGSAIMGLVLLDAPWRYAPLTIAILCTAFIASRPSH